MELPRGARAVIKRAVTRVGLAPYVEAVRGARRPWAVQRDARDMQNLTLLMRFWFRPDWCCIDIGANRGAILRQMLELAPRGNHLAFEPVPTLAAQLRAEFPSVDVREVALTDHTGISEFVHVLDKEGFSGLREQWYPREMYTESISVRVDRLDDCLPEGYRPDFIKIDVEGAESNVFAGGLKTIAKYRPVIVFEHGAIAATSAKIYDMLVDEARLEIYDIEGNGPLSRQQLVDGLDVWNFVARAAPDS